MDNHSQKLDWKEWLTDKEQKKITFIPLPLENKVCLSIKNNVKENVHIEVYEIVIKIMRILNFYNILFSISHQYKNDKKGIHHIDITYEIQ